MLNKLNSLRDREDGFTLIELLIVVIIIGILAAIALPIFINQQKVAVDASVKSDVRNTVTNITNSQAQGLTTATAAVSGSATSIALYASADASGTALSTATKAATGLTGVPAIGSQYSLKGTNAGGTATGAVAGYTFSSTSGQFSS